jgi:hypothetical protein
MKQNLDIYLRNGTDTHAIISEWYITRVCAEREVLRCLVLPAASINITVFRDIRHVVWQKFTHVSDILTASIIRAINI